MKVTQRFIPIQAVWQSDNDFTHFEPQWNNLKFEAEKTI